MPTTVAQAFSAFQLAPEGVVRWGSKPAASGPGVYVVSLTSETDRMNGSMQAAPLAISAFEGWLRVRPELTLDGARPTVQKLMDRVGRFWLPDEVIVYIGLATSLSARVEQYYATPIGARRPHAGGHFLKLLSNLSTLHVHYACCPDPNASEDAMLGRFCTHVSESTLRRLHDPDHPFPFANLEWPRGVRKRHGLRGAREPRSAARGEVRTSPVTAAPRDLSREEGHLRTQRVTAVDLRQGRIRVPSETKSLFPAARQRIPIAIRGELLDASWDPRSGDDRERSGVLGVGRNILPSLVRENEVLLVAKNEDGQLSME